MPMPMIRLTTIIVASKVVSLALMVMREVSVQTILFRLEGLTSHI
jgi:hypothetical protein